MSKDNVNQDKVKEFNNMMSEYHFNRIYEQRNLLLNFLGLAILGGFLLVFLQGDISQSIKTVKNTIVLFYYLALICLIFAKYLLMDNHRKWYEAISEHLKLNKQSSFVYNHIDYLFGLFSISSALFFLAGSLFGLYGLFKGSVQFGVCLLATLLLFVCGLRELIIVAWRKKI